MKSVVWWSIGLLFGLGLVALGLFGSGEPSAKVLCGSEEMRPGQTCDRTQYGQTTSETYEEKRQDSIDTANTFKNGGRWVTFGIGAGIGALCGWRLTVAIRRRAGQGSGPVVQAVPAQQPGFAPPPGYAPQGFQQQQGFAQQQPGFPPPQGYRQPPPPGYQQPRGPYQQ
ncbi:hypothetical protein [Amycolatopsis sp. RTGN1]|uniref:hypothetical protein n=1 Tax=Amycolatopsis ponsaeliensis TaxID=2992142 RepID=UPI002551BBEE|nr:hypothetical protein [Amycolatopsis sp. RTGN1]